MGLEHEIVMLDTIHCWVSAAIHGWCLFVFCIISSENSIHSWSLLSLNMVKLVQSIELGQVHTI